MRLRLGAVACAMVLAQLAGCAGRTPYADESATKNVSIHTATSAKSIFSRVHALLDIYSVDRECRAQYAGTVKLDRPSVAIGIAADRWSYLVFDFASSSFLAGRHGHMSYELFFKPQADHRYEIEVTYHDEIYDVVLGERQPHGTLREMPDLDVEPCVLSRWRKEAREGKIVTKGAVLLLCMVSWRSESVCVDHWEIAEAPTSGHVDALRRKDESEDIFNELNGRQERICAPCSSGAARSLLHSKANRIEPATQIHILVADRTRSLGSAYSTSLAAYEPSWPVNSNWLHVEVNFMDQSKGTPNMEAARNNTTGPARNIVDTAIAAGNFSIFAAAIKAAGLTEALAAQGPFTVFAPTDEAFKSLPTGAYDELLKDTGKLKAILNYHVIAGRVMAKDLKSGEVMTQQGTTLTSTPSSSSNVRVNAARVVKADLLASNGIIHAIDAVILPKNWQLTAAAA